MTQHVEIKNSDSNEEKSNLQLTQEQKIFAYKAKLKSLANIEKSNFEFLNSFNGEFSRSKSFANEINNLKLEKEFLDLCVSMYPNIFEIKSENKKNILETKELKIRKENFEFTKDQKVACRKFLGFMTNPAKITFGLYGFSGTGKTTTLVEIVTYLLSNKLIKSVVFSAPTNKAVNVMKNKFEKYIREIYSLYSGQQKEQFDDLMFEDLIWKLSEFGITIEFTTIHKLLNFDFDFDNEGKLQFKKSKESEMQKYNLIVIDECSMLPAQMVDTIFSDIRDNYDITKSAKIVFSGDIAQLPPVNEKNSVIFSKEEKDFPFEAYLDSMGIDSGADDFVKKTCFKLKYDKLIKEITSMDHFVMKQVVRSKSGNVLGVCNTIRDWALEEVDKFKIGKFIDSLDCHAYKYIKFTKKTNSDWFKKFVEQCAKKQDSIILTWTNKQCDEYNNEIRKELFKNNKEANKAGNKEAILDTFLPGDILMLSDFYSMKRSKDDDNDKFYTSEQIKVVNLEIVEKLLDIFPQVLDKKSQKLENAKNYEEYYKKTLEKINSTVKKTYKCWKLYVKRISSRTEETSIIYVIHDEYKKLHEAEKEYIENCIKKMRHKLVTKYKEKTSVIDNHITKYFWKNFHSIYVQPFANVNYGYCITCHKAQGSTFYNVFVDLEDIVRNTNDNEMRRCLYTAVSRTSNELHLLV
jgi:hypothetical protein